jgi:DNA-3-methyladenine glycosylase II
LQQEVHPLTPGRFLTLTGRELKRIGFSRQKALYTRLLAEEIAERRLDLNNLDSLPDQDAHNKLTALKGIGNWTADIYLLSALRRPDIWPVGDLALATAVQEVKRLRPNTLKRYPRLGVPGAPLPLVCSGIIT